MSLGGQLPEEVVLGFGRWSRKKALDSREVGVRESESAFDLKMGRTFWASQALGRRWNVRPGSLLGPDQIPGVGGSRLLRKHLSFD